VLSIGGPISTTNPVSSVTSRSAVCATVSSFSGVPFGSAQSDSDLLWHRATIRAVLSCGSGRNTTPPADQRSIECSELIHLLIGQNHFWGNSYVMIGDFRISVVKGQTVLNILFTELIINLKFQYNTN